jgi:hypothetical protein
MQFLVYLLILLTTPHIPQLESKVERKFLQAHAKMAHDYCLQHSMDTSLCILIDMKKHSGRNRFYVWDFQNDSVLLLSLVSHGCGDSTWAYDMTKTNPVFSNTPESYCSSLGRYKIGKRDYSSWGIGIHYKLHGLDSTNSNAFKRVIVLHSWSRVYEEEPYPFGTAEGHGCPAISNGKMHALDVLLRKKKNVLLWIYN